MFLQNTLCVNFYPILQRRQITFEFCHIKNAGPSASLPGFLTFPRKTVFATAEPPVCVTKDVADGGDKGKVVWGGNCAGFTSAGATAVRRGDSLSESATRWPSFRCVCDPLHPWHCRPDTRECYCLRPDAVHFTVSMGADVRRRRRKRRKRRKRGRARRSCAARLRTINCSQTAFCHSSV